ncbi:MAG: ABC transporter ATP-binding protein [Bacteroidetes bacterium]|nr:MAG: ABC transporter ATP-binding protein [Bacteroidota bacterium]
MQNYNNTSADNNKEILLKVSNLQVDFKTEDGIFTAVKNLNFELYRGEILGIVGESGSGKSVSSMAIMGILSKMASLPKGSINYYPTEDKNIELSSISESEYQNIRGKDISMIFQEPMTSLNPVYKCGDQVVEAIILHQKISKKEAKIKAIELFNDVELPRPEKIYNSYPHQISGGQKQRVMIAMAISSKPSLLIADEPTTALDVRVQKRILEILKNLQKKYNMSVIFITHDLGVIAQIAQRVLVMYRGELIESGNIEQIFNNAKHAYTRGLINCRPKTEIRSKQLPTVNDYLNLNDKEIAIKLEAISQRQRDTEHKKLYASEPILQVNNLSTTFVSERNIFGKVTAVVNAVNNVNIEVYPGETLGLVGESGCGKTTLGRTILQMIPSSNGIVTYKNKNLSELPKNELRNLRKEIQIIFQDPYSSLNPRITIGDAIMEPMKVHNILKNNTERKKRVIELLERVGLTAEQYSRYPHEFSGGQRQRIVIARSLALNPKFIVCDESVSALDVSVQAQVLNLLNELKKEYGLTYIFISHDLSVVKYMSDRILVMRDGKIEEIGEADELYNNPKTNYTKELIEAIPEV